MRTRRNISLQLCIALLGAALIGLISLPIQGVAEEKDKVIAIAAARVETISQGSIRDGVIIIRNGKIAEVGRALPIPEGAELIDVGEGTVIPGLVLVASRIGLSRSSRGTRKSPHHRVLDELDAYRNTYERLLAGGVTTLNLMPSGGGVMGQSVTISARRGPRQDVTLRESSALFMSIDATTSSKSTLRGELARGKKAIEARKKKKEAEEKKKQEAKKKEKTAAPKKKRRVAKKKEDEPPKPDPKVQPLVDVLEGNLPLIIRCQDTAAAAHLFPILEEYRKDPYKTRPTLYATPGMWQAVELLEDKNVAVILPALISYERNTRNRVCPPAILSAAGIDVALIPGSDSEEGIQNFLLYAAQMVKHGMRRQDALEAVTLTPAKILGLDRRVGSIEQGKDANLVILSGDPFHGATRIDQVILQGKVVHRFGERPDTTALLEDKTPRLAKKTPPAKPKPDGKKGESESKPAGKDKGKKDLAKEEEKKKKDPPVAIVGADILTITNGKIRRGTIIIEDGKIQSVGSDLPVPEGAKVIDAKGLVACPGFVAARCRGLGIRRRGPGGGKLADALDPYAFSVHLALASGITTAFITSRSGGSGLIQGTSAVIKMTEEDLGGMLVREPACVQIRYSGASASAKFALKELLRKAVDYARKLKEEKAKGKAGKPPRQGGRAAALLPLIRGEVPARIAASSADDILAALELADEFGIRLVLEGAHESWIVAEEISKRDVCLVITPRRKAHADKTVDRPSGSNLRMPALLRKAGVPFAILSPNASLSTGGIAGQDMVTLPIDAAFAVGRGLDEQTALESITITAARALGVADRVGSIEPGKDADIILLDGHPLDYRSFVTLAMVNGKVYYEKNKSPVFAPFGRRPSEEAAETEKEGAVPVR
ncbi:MAG: amidohydrolase family protein [Planctomycetota bacterium]|nr:amidohydrolase family protein [Planctomycetota bacterium]